MQYRLGYILCVLLILLKKLFDKQRARPIISKIAKMHHLNKTFKTLLVCISHLKDNSQNSQDQQYLIMEAFLVVAERLHLIKQNQSLKTFMHIKIPKYYLNYFIDQEPLAPVTLPKIQIVSRDSPSTKSAMYILIIF